MPMVALLMAACSNDGSMDQTAVANADVQNLQVYPVVNGLTRGTVWTNNNFESFHLSTSGDGFLKAIDGTETANIDGTVSKSSGIWRFDDGITYYWPSKNATANFLAYAPVSFKPSANYTADADDLSKLMDIVVAYNTGTAFDFSMGVPLTFRHATSQIVVKADNASTSDVTIEVKAIRLKNICSSAYFTMPTTPTTDNLLDNPWTLNSTSTDYMADLSSVRTLSGTAADVTGDNPLLLIPQQLGSADIAQSTGQYLSVLIKVTAADGTPIFPVAQTDASGKAITNTGYAWVATDINTLWEPGKRYIYTLHFQKDSYGKIDSDQDDGGTDDPADPTPDNDSDDDDIPGPGDDVVDTPVELTINVTVSDWTEQTENTTL